MPWLLYVSKSSDLLGSLLFPPNIHIKWFDPQSPMLCSKSSDLSNIWSISEEAYVQVISIRHSYLDSSLNLQLPVLPSGIPDLLILPLQLKDWPNPSSFIFLTYHWHRMCNIISWSLGQNQPEGGYNTECPRKCWVCFFLGLSRFSAHPSISMTTFWN